jgi:HEAT repeat protein
VTEEQEGMTDGKEFTDIGESDRSERDISAADIASFLEQGLLENLVILFRSEPSLYPLLAELLSDERIGVRLGTSALVESLADEDPGGTGRATDALLPLLAHENPVVRGDAAYLLGILGRREALAGLRALEADENADVRDAVDEALERIIANPG